MLATDRWATGFAPDCRFDTESSEPCWRVMAGAWREQRSRTGLKRLLETDDAERLRVCEGE